MWLCSAPNFPFQSHGVFPWRKWSHLNEMVLEEQQVGCGYTRWLMILTLTTIKTLGEISLCRQWRNGHTYPYVTWRHRLVQYKQFHTVHDIECRRVNLLAEDGKDTADFTEDNTYDEEISGHTWRYHSLECRYKAVKLPFYTYSWKKYKVTFWGWFPLLSTYLSSFNAHIYAIILKKRLPVISSPPLN